MYNYVMNKLKKLFTKNVKNETKEEFLANIKKHNDVVDIENIEELLINIKKHNKSYITQKDYFK